MDNGYPDGDTVLADSLCIPNLLVVVFEADPTLQAKEPMSQFPVASGNQLRI
jgi:hypothetical protein